MLKIILVVRSNIDLVDEKVFFPAGKGGQVISIPVKLKLNLLTQSAFFQKYRCVLM